MIVAAKGVVIRVRQVHPPKVPITIDAQVANFDSNAVSRRQSERAALRIHCDRIYDSRDRRCKARWPVWCSLSS